MAARAYPLALSTFESHLICCDLNAGESVASGYVIVHSEAMKATPKWSVERNARRLTLSLTLTLALAACQQQPEEAGVRGRSSCRIAGKKPTDPQPTIIFGVLHAHTSS
jgi:hypothetical protein